MATFNQCQFIGRLGKDPDLQVNVTTWDKLAETVEKYAHKGMLVFVQGKLQQRPYKDKQHIDRISVEIIATVVQLLEKRKTDDEIPDDVLPPE